VVAVPNATSRTFSDVETPTLDHVAPPSVLRASRPTLPVAHSAAWPERTRL
jgi:hypothetical protein